MKKALLILVLACTVLLGRAQVPCDSAESVFRKLNARLDQLNTEDPEIISLHYLFLQDILREMERFKTSTMPALPHCLSTDYYLVKSHFQKVAYRAGQMERLLGTRKGLVDRIFYNQAVEELHYRDTVNALYNLDRALEFNKYQPDALLLKAKLKSKPL